MAFMTIPDELPVQFSTSWPEPRKRWHSEAKQYVGVYGLQWEDHMYVGMTVSSTGFQGRWGKHLRALFIRKRANTTTKKMRDIIKKNELTPGDFTLHALKGWENPGEDLTLALTHEIALEEQRIYDLLADAGFTMMNNVRPRGTGYAKATRKKRRRRVVRGQAGVNAIVE